MLPWKKISQRRQDFINSRKNFSISEETFIHDIEEHPNKFERVFISAIRATIANECCISPEKIAPSDSCVILNGLMGPDSFIGFYFQPICGWDGFDPYIFHLKLEFFINKYFVSFLKIDERRLFSLIHFGKDKDFSTDCNQTLKDWVISLKNELLFFVDEKKMCASPRLLKRPQNTGMIFEFQQFVIFSSQYLNLRCLRGVLLAETTVKIFQCSSKITIHLKKN